MKENQISQVKEFSTFLYMGRDTKITAHWNHPFHMNLSYLGPVSCAFSSQVSSGCTVRGGCSSWLLDAGHPVSILNSLRAHSWCGCNVMALWLQHPLFTDMAGNIFFSLIQLRCSCCYTCILLMTQRVKETKEGMWWGQQKPPQYPLRRGYLGSYGLSHSFKIPLPAPLSSLNSKYILNTWYFTFPGDIIPFSICEVGLYRQTSQVLLKKINICLFIMPGPHCRCHGFTTYS